MLRNPSPSVPKIQAYRIIIIPTLATGSSHIVPQSSKIISFNWPDKKADKLKGKIGEATDKEKDTYLSIFERVFDEQLAAFEKSVVGVLDRVEEDQTFSCSTTVRFRRKLGDEESSNYCMPIIFRGRYQLMHSDSYGLGQISPGCREEGKLAYCPMFG